MKALWENYAEKFNARNLRERIIISMCVLAAIYLLWELALLGGIRSERQTLDKRYQSASSEMKKVEAEKQVFTEALKNNPNAKKQQQIVHLKERLESLDRDIESLSAGLVACLLYTSDAADD